MATKLFLDDQRDVPIHWDSNWSLCRDADEARALLKASSEALKVCSLDHDLGYGEDGQDFLKWMCNERCVPGIVGIHSGNPEGVKNMMALLVSYKKVVDPSIKVYPYDYLSVLMNKRNDLELWPGLVKEE